MPPQARLGDKAIVPADAHGCPACPHIATGSAISGSPDVMVNGLAAIRVNDSGTLAGCCSANTWHASAGSDSVLINYRPAHRLGDTVSHGSTTGTTIEGSPDVIIGDTSAAAPEVADPAVPHDKSTTISLYDDYDRKLDQIRLTIRCVHNPTRYIEISSGDTVDSLCIGTTIDVENWHETIVRH